MLIIMNTIGKNLKLGDQKDAVGLLQTMLLSIAISIDPKEVEDKNFGTSTEEAVKTFQRQKLLEVTGIADNPTATKLTHLYENDGSIKYPVVGHLKNPKGHPVPFLKVEAWRSIENEDECIATTRANEKGTFKFFFSEREAHNIELHRESGLYFRVYDENGGLVLNSADTQQRWTVTYPPEEIQFTVTLRSPVQSPSPEEQVTRLCMIGSGIICGLELHVDEDYTVTIQSGDGITSDGTYVKVASKQVFGYYAAYSGTSGYSPFNGIEDVWQLLDKPDGYPLKPQNSEEELNPFLRDKVVVLFLEANEAGKLVPQFLLLRQRDVLQQLDILDMTHRLIWEGMGDDDDFIYGDDYNPEDTRPRIDTLNLAINPALQLPELYLRHLGFSSGDPFDCPPEGVDASVFPEISNLGELFDAYKPAIDEATRKLDKALTQLHRGFHKMMQIHDVDFYTQTVELLCLKWEEFKRENEEETVDNKYYVQYFYGWVRDLIQAYNELRDELIDLVVACCSNKNSFPRHLLLGVEKRQDLARQPQVLRSIFRQPPIYNGNANRLECFRLYTWRILTMIRGFYLPDYVTNPKINPYIEQDEKPDLSQLKITPSRFYDAPLGEQSIPYYYPVSVDRFSVHHFWNCRRTRTSSTDQILSYHASDFDDSHTMRHQAVRPLHYKLDNYPFFRIEGHIGRRLGDYPDITTNEETTNIPGVVSELNYLIQKYNLPLSFELVPLHEENPFTYNYGTTDQNDGKTDNNEEIESPFYSLHQEYLGAEHLAGTKACGLFILLYEPQRDEHGNVLLDENGNIEKDGVIVADFFSPRCHDSVEFHRQSTIPSAYFADKQKMPSLEPLTSSRGGSLKREGDEETDETTLLDSLGTADGEDDLSLIDGIGEKTEEKLKQMGVKTYKQISKMTDKEYDMVDELIGGTIKGKGKREEWALKAQELLDKKND